MRRGERRQRTFLLGLRAPLADTAVRGEERKVVSVLFVDLVGFTAASETVDPEDVRARLRPYHARVKRDARDLLARLGAHPAVERIDDLLAQATSRTA